MVKIHPYLIFNGDAEAAFNFYKDAFGASFLNVQRFKEGPGFENATDEEKEMILHISMEIAPGYILMASDCPPTVPAATTGTNISLSVDAASKEEADRVFNALAEGGEITMPLADTFWNAYFGMLRDKFGIMWMVNYDHGKKE